jgi:phytoene dehydrogenase-like protein
VDERGVTTTTSGPTVAPVTAAAASPAAVTTADAVVIGAGPNGLVAANALADAGWDVVLVEQSDRTGGAVRSDNVTAPGFVTDMFSAFYPLAAASSVIRGLELERHGLTWCRAPSVLAHALDDGRAAVLHSRVEDTAAGLEESAAGDGDAWVRMFEGWQRVRDPLLDALFTPIPPVMAVSRMLARVGTAGMLDLARLALLPVRRLGTETFRGDGGPLLLTGNAMHSDVPPDSAGSGLLGWLLAMMGQDVGFPVPEGGAGELAQALTRRAQSRGAEVRVNTPAVRVEVHQGRATAVHLADGSRIQVRRAVLADVPAPGLYEDLVGRHYLPAAFVDSLERFQWDNPTIKVNWAMSRSMPWSAAGAHGAGTVHLGVDLDGFVDMAADLSVGRVPQRPFLLFGQMTTSDPTRSPAGTESTWAYTHVPHGHDWTGEVLDAHVDRMEAAVDRVAPGFRDHVLARHVQSPEDLEAADPNLVGGAVNAGTSALHQQLFLRPTPGLGRPETPITGLYLASASAHPGGGVHGACGWNAAQVALGAAGWTGPARRALTHTAWGRLLRRS